MALAVPDACDERSSYLRQACRDPSVIANRDLMIRCYLDDIQRLAARTPPPPPHRGASAEEAPGSVSPQASGPSATVRLVTWNVNILMGPDGNSRVDPKAVASVLEPLNADVIALQEAPAAGLEAKWSESWFAEPVKRVQELAQLLQDMGYAVLRSPADNGTLLATRLPVARAEEGPILDEQPVRSVNGNSIWEEVRAARYVELALPGASGRTVAVYATHLHHKDIEKTSSGGDLPGVRLREAGVLLRHWRAQAAAKAARRPAATVVLADYNQPRRCDYGAEEWHVVVTGLAHPQVAQPGDDGVADLMVSEGFSSSFDVNGASRNFASAGAAPFTHWTGTTIDFAYINSAPDVRAEVVGVYSVYTPLSDHLPVVTDLLVEDSIAE